MSHLEYVVPLIEKRTPLSGSLSRPVLSLSEPCAVVWVLCEMSPSRPPMDSIIFSTRMARSSPCLPQARSPSVALRGILTMK